MPWVSSTSAARRHGAYGIERTPAAVIRAKGTGVAACVVQTPWGPDGTLVYTPSGPKDLIYRFAPPGMNHLSTGYLAFTQKAFPTLKVVRANDPASVAASSILTAAGPTNIVTVAAKYKGTAGNSLVATVAAAGDGNANHFKLTVSVTGASGTTSEVFDNLNYSGTGADSTPDFTNSYLVGSITKNNSGRPTNGTFTFGSGTDGTINSAKYTGTAGAGDAGIAALEGDNLVRHVFIDDCGNSLRSAVNTALKTHCESLGNRVCYMNGNTGQSASAAQTDAGNYSSERVVYCDPWVYVYDDVTGAKQLVPSSPYAASVGAQLSPSTSIAWKDPEVGAMLGTIVDLEADRGQAAADNTDHGVATFIKEANGGYRIEAGVCTIAPADPTKRNLTRRRMGDYAEGALEGSTRSFIDAPNVPSNQQNIVTAVQVFMEGLKNAANSDPNHTPHCLDYSIPDLKTFNSQSDLDNGNLTIPVDMKTSSGIERLFFSFRFGEGVTVR